MSLSVDKQTRLKQLRELIGAYEKEPERSVIPASQGTIGIPKGAITELRGAPGSGRTEWVLTALRENPTLRVAWLEEKLELYPPALVQREISLMRVVFVETHTELPWAALQIIRSQLFDLTVIGEREWRYGELRNLQLTAEKAGVAVVILSAESQARWGGLIALPLSVEDRAVQRKEMR